MALTRQLGRQINKQAEWGTVINGQSSVRQLCSQEISVQGAAVDGQGSWAGECYPGLKKKN